MINTTNEVNKTINTTFKEVNLTADDVVMIYKDGSRLYASLLDSRGNPIANATIFFTINGITYNRTTDVNGSAYPFSGEQRGFNVLVKPLIDTTDLTKYYNNASKFEAKIYNKDGSLAANKSVTFNINGVFYTRTADENCTVKLAITLRPGDYIITSMYEGLSIGNKVKVLPTLQTSDLSMTW